MTRSIDSLPGRKRSRQIKPWLSNCITPSGNAIRRTMIFALCFPHGVFGYSYDISSPERSHVARNLASPSCNGNFLIRISQSTSWNSDRRLSSWPAGSLCTSDYVGHSCASCLSWGCKVYGAEGVPPSLLCDLIVMYRSIALWDDWQSSCLW